jgi:hypothetical protein
MQPEIRKACRRAGLKFGTGLVVIGAVLGIRVVTVEPRGVEDGIAELETIETELESASAPSARTTERPASTTGERAVGDAPGFRAATETEAGALASSPEPEPHAGDALVSCRLRGSSQFMRAADCAMRGGRATPLADDR